MFLFLTCVWSQEYCSTVWQVVVVVLVSFGEFLCLRSPSVELRPGAEGPGLLSNPSGLCGGICLFLELRGRTRLSFSVIRETISRYLSGNSSLPLFLLLSRVCLDSTYSLILKKVKTHTVSCSVLQFLLSPASTTVVLFFQKNVYLLFFLVLFMCLLLRLEQHESVCENRKTSLVLNMWPKVWATCQQQQRFYWP